MKVIPIATKTLAASIAGGVTQTSKMPCQSYSLPTSACKTGRRMAQLPGSICSTCYADKGFYQCYRSTIQPAQERRLASLNDPRWVAAMVKLIGGASYFRWHDSGDLQSLEHLEQIVDVARQTPETEHWLPTREYAIVARYIAKHGRDAIPANLIIRLSAMFPDRPVSIPASLRGVPGIATSNVHATDAPHGLECGANKRGGKCGDCRACWDRSIDAVSYRLH